jgi:putative ABC transport system permease protein
VGRLAWSQLRFRTGRTAALLAGMLVAVTAFSVLTAAARTSQLRTIGTLTAHFRTAYDILVRPRGARTSLEARSGTVQPDFLSGIYGGITLAQYRQIGQIPGVAVAAPIAMVGYSLPGEPFTVRLPASEAGRPGRALFRYTTTWISASGASRVRQPASFVYVTPRRLGLDQRTGASFETLPGGSRVTVCPVLTRAAGPFAPAVQSQAWCWSRIDGEGPGAPAFGSLSGTHPGIVVEWRFPILIAAIDPVAEARLDGLDRAVTAGRYLAEQAGPGRLVPPGGTTLTTFPVLASASSGLGEYSLTQVQRLATPAAPPELGPAGMRAAAAGQGRTVLTVRITAQQAYQRLLAAMAGAPGGYPGIDDYWTVGSTRYRAGPGGSLVPVPERNPAAVWRSALTNAGFVAPPMDNTDNQYRALADHGPVSRGFTGAGFPEPIPRLSGIFAPGRIEAFGPLSRVPLGAFAPVAAAPADAASRRVLAGHDLLPSLNLGGYVSQPPQLITTLAALPALENSEFFSGDVHAQAPISVIRVRVAGVYGPDPVSRERIQLVAQQIAVRTGLTVDIVTGSSPAPTAIQLPAGRFGQPALQLSEGWVRKGVAVTILTAVDRKSAVLFGLILVVCGLFVANSATAAVRSRRQELGVLACLGWTRARLFAAVLGEVALIGLAAGIVGGLIALPLARALGLGTSPGRALLAVPAAVLLAVVAGAGPAWLASRADPVAAVRPPVLAVRRGQHPAGITGLAVVNVLRTPGRALLGAVSLAAGVAALTVLTGVTLAFRGVVVGSLLGNAVAVEIRGVDYLAVIATVALGLLAVADVVFISIRERAPELAAIRALGWPESALARLIVTEGAVIGLAGAAAGAVAGLLAAAGFTHQLPPRLVAAAVAAAAAGALLAAAVAAIPVQLLRRLPTARLLAED